MHGIREFEVREKLNILIVADIIPCDREGGSGHVAWELSRNLAKRGHHVVVLTCGQPGLLGTQEKEGIEIWRFQNDLFKCRKFFQELNNKYHFDVVNFHHPFSALGVMPFFRKNEIPVVYIFYSPWPEEYLIRSEDLRRGYLKEKIGIKLRKYLEGKVLKKSERLIVLSKFMKERLKNWHSFPEEKISVIPGGVNLERFKPVNQREELRKKLNLLEDKFLLLTVRNLVSRMGLENLILAMSKLVNTYPDIFLVIGGRGYLEKKLKDLVIKLNLEQWISFAGYIPDELLPAYYQSADLFILPTKSLEGFGLITLEALACGTPVLATPVGGTVEILEKFDKSFLFRGTSPEDIAEGIKKFLEQKDEYPNLREKCRKFVEENYSWDKFTDGVEKIFYEVTLLPKVKVSP